MSETGERVERVYAGFRGVDFRGEEINLVRSPDSLNVWKDYKYTDSIRTRPTMERLFGSLEVHSFTVFKDAIYCHAGKILWKLTHNDVGAKEYTKVCETLADHKSVMFVAEYPQTTEACIYILDGEKYWCLRPNKVVDGKPLLQEVDGYVPTTSIGRKPTGEENPSGGQVMQDVNMLQKRRINTFMADGKNTVYWLNAYDIDKDFTPIVKSLDGQVLPKHTVDYDKGTITFASVPPLPLTDGQDNISVEFAKTIPEYRKAIEGCTMVQAFDNRVFVSGNPDYPNTVWHCSLNDPTYFADTDMYLEGLDDAKVTGMVAGNNALWVFREPSVDNTTVFYHTPAIDAEYGKIYPDAHSSVALGCVGKAINFNDDIVFFSQRGMEGISGDVTTEQVIAHRSSLVDRKLVAEDDYRNMVLAEWAGYLIVFIGNKAYLADSRTAVTVDDHIEYEWFYWEMEKAITAAISHNGSLYLGTDDGVYELMYSDKPIESYWVTPKDKFKCPHKQKTTNKRGCVGEATGDITVYAKVEDTDFEYIGEYKDVKDYFVSRIKRKKFKDIQLKFHSNTRFSLESVTLEAWIGGYIKR